LKRWSRDFEKTCLEKMEMEEGTATVKSLSPLGRDSVAIT